MERTATYELLVIAIAEAMRTLAMPEAKRLAQDVTAIINEELGFARGKSEMVTLASRLVPMSVRNLASIGAGWDAFRQTYEPETVALQVPPRVQMVCTLPSSFRNLPDTRSLGQKTGLWAGSLMASIHELIDRAQEELIIVAPYWSQGGVSSLLRHVTRETMSEVRVRIMTQPRHKLNDFEREGVLQLRDALFKKGATVQILSPRQYDGKTALLHAKTIVRDGVEAYLGSANFTANGVEQGFELGVRLEGGAARNIKTWADTLACHFELWE